MNYKCPLLLCCIPYRKGRRRVGGGAEFNNIHSRWRKIRLCGGGGGDLNSFFVPFVLFSYSWCFLKYSSWEGGGKSAQWEIHGGDFFLFENSSEVITADRVPNIRMYIEGESQISLGIRSESSIQGRDGNPTLSELARFQGDRRRTTPILLFITIFCRSEI